MTREASAISENLSRPEVAVSGQNWPHFAGVMRVVRACLGGGKYDALADDLAGALGCSQRTARRIIAGQSVSSDTTLAALTHETIGPRLLEEILSRLPVERRAAMAKALSEAADLSRMEAEQEVLARKVAARRSRPNELTTNGSNRRP